MGHKMVIHAENYKKGSVGALQRHNFRENETYGNVEIDCERTKDNIILKSPDISQYQDTKKIIEERAVNQVRVTSIWQSEFIISSSNSFFRFLPVEEQKRFFQEAYNYLCKEFGEENVVSAVIHFDETTPHMHFDFVPMTEDNKLSRKEVMTKARLGNIQDKMPKYMQEKGFDVERGCKTSDLALKDRPRHIDSKEYKKGLQREIRALEGQKKALDEQWKKQYQEMEQEEKTVRVRQKKVKDMEKILKEHKDILKEKMQDYNNQIKSINELPKGQKIADDRYILSESGYNKLMATARNGILLHDGIKEWGQEIQKLKAENERLKEQIMPIEKRIKLNKQIAETDFLKAQNKELTGLARKILLLAEKMQLSEEILVLLRKMAESNKRSSCKRNVQER